MASYQHNQARISTYAYRKTADVVCRLTKEEMQALHKMLEKFGARSGGLYDLFNALDEATNHEP